MNVEASHPMQAITKLRFDALAGYIRAPETALVSDELEWYSERNDRVLAVLFRDVQDNDFSAAILARDRKGRFRAVDQLKFSDSADEARSDLGPAMQAWAARPDADYEQGDEKGPRLDFFEPLVDPGRFNPGFAAVRQRKGHSPAKELVAAMMHYYEDPDGNFVQQFQTTGFDARIWELYLFATFTELGYSFDRTHAAPDFFCRGLLGEFFVEAISANPTMTNGINAELGLPKDEPERRRYLAEYMPIKWGSALFSKLEKSYWDLPHIAGKPIVFAIQDFHLPGSMSWSEPSLVTYLYGRQYTALHGEDGRLNISPHVVEEHRWGDKVIPSGFFRQPGAENISAVAANPQGTITKFNRIGFKAGFGSRSVRMVRRGTHYVHDANAARPQPFVKLVHEPGYSETWVEGMNVYHNPTAIVPLPWQLVPGAAHHFLESNGQVRSLIPPFHPYGTQTVIVAGV